MDLDLVFLGTSGSVPTARRGLSSALIRRGGERLLLDCGEGTQRQLMRSCGLSDLDAVFVTHLHADHVLGLPGMLKTFNLRERAAPLVIAGPPGIARFWRQLEFVVGTLRYPVDVREVVHGAAWEGDGYTVDAVATEHGVPSVGWVLREDDRPGRFDVAAAEALGVEPGRDYGRLQRGESVTSTAGAPVQPQQVLGEARTGRTVVYSGDTRACSALRDAARHATLLVHEATFLQEDAARAADTRHATALDAGLLAAAAQVSMLVLTHVSTRYPPRDLAAEAGTAFPGAVVARDFDVVELPVPERGAPTLLPRAARAETRSGARPAAPAADMITAVDDTAAIDAVATSPG